MKQIITISNTISLLRAPLALLLLFHSVTIRMIAITLAMISDFADGYLARRLKTETFLGKVLDPVMDKFFVYFVMGILTYEGTLSKVGLLALLVRDFAIILYVLTVTLFYGWSKLVFLPAISSKITTGLQFITILALVLTFPIPVTFYFIYFILAPLIYIELMSKTIQRQKSIK